MCEISIILIYQKLGSVGAAQQKIKLPLPYVNIIILIFGVWLTALQLLIFLSFFSSKLLYDLFFIYSHLFVDGFILWIRQCGFNLRIKFSYIFFGFIDGGYAKIDCQLHQLFYTLFLNVLPFRDKFFTLVISSWIKVEFQTVWCKFVFKALFQKLFV